MSKLIVTQGIQCSGKTTFAEELVAQGKGQVVNVCRDDLRLEMFGRKRSDAGKWKHEDEVVKERNRRLEKALAQGKTAISSDTNFNEKHLAYFKQLAEKYGAEFELKEFYVPVSVAEERDARRADGVTPKVLRKFWRENVCKPYSGNKMLPRIITVDLDNTIAHMTNRDPFQEQFVEDDDYDEVVGAVAQAAAKALGAKIAISSGRHDSCQESTERWLKKYNFKYDAIYMRRSGDNRPDWTVKGEIFRKICKKYYLIAAFDDRIAVCDLLREMGVQCFNCADGVF